MRNRFRRHAALCAILGLHLLLSGGYALRTPAFEAPDENGHFYYATFVAQRFPEQPIVLGSHEIAGRSVWSESDLGHHPPGYYLLLASVLHLLGSDDILPTQRARGSLNGAFQFDHGHDEFTVPSFEIGILHRLRAVSVVLGALSLALAYACARSLWPDRPRVASLTALLLATLPQWSYTHGCLDNGNLATTLSHLVLWVLARSLSAGPIAIGRGIGLGIALGIATGAALWTKATALALGPIIAVVLGIKAWREPALRQVWVRALWIAGAIAVACLAPQVMRNLSLYGEPLAQKAHESAFAASRLREPASLEWLFGFLVPNLGRSFVGMFGWWRVGLPSLAYLAFAMLGAVGLLGATVGRSRSVTVPGRKALLVAAITFGTAIVVQFNLTFAQPQGRYLFPVAGPICAVIALGLVHLLEQSRFARQALFVLHAALVAGALAVFLGVFLPAFGLRPDSAADPYAAIVSGGLRSQPPTSQIEFGSDDLEPEDGVSLDDPPTFRVHAANTDAPLTLHLWLDSGCVLGASYEQVRIDLAGGAFTLPADIWERVPHGAFLLWNVRRVADREAGEDPRSMPGSSSRRVRRR